MLWTKRITGFKVGKDKGVWHLVYYKVNLFTGTIYFLVMFMLLLFGNTHWYLALTVPTGGD